MEDPLAKLSLLQKGLDTLNLVLQPHHASTDSSVNVGCFQQRIKLHISTNKEQALDCIACMFTLSTLQTGKNGKSTFRLIYISQVDNKGR